MSPTLSASRSLLYSLPVTGQESVEPGAGLLCLWEIGRFFYFSRVQWNLCFLLVQALMYQVRLYHVARAFPYR